MCRRTYSSWAKGAWTVSISVHVESLQNPCCVISLCTAKYHAKVCNTCFRHPQCRLGAKNTETTNCGSSTVRVSIRSIGYHLYAVLTSTNVMHIVNILPFSVHMLYNKLLLPFSVLQKARLSHNKNYHHADFLLIIWHINCNLFNPLLIKHTYQQSV